jgi:hypothetical protein
MKEEQTVWVVYEDYHGSTSMVGVFTDRDVAEEVSNQSNRYYIDSVILNAK